MDVKILKFLKLQRDLSKGLVFLFSYKFSLHFSLQSSGTDPTYDL